MSSLSDIREQIPVTTRTVYLNNAASGPLLKPAAAAMQRAIDEQSYLGSNWGVWTPFRKVIAEKFANLVGASVEEVGYAPNVTTALWALSSALPLGKEKNVVLNDLEFPTNVYPWLSWKEMGRIGEVRMLRNQRGVLTIEQFEEAIDKNTAVVPLTYVSSLNGFRPKTREIAKIAHERGASVVSDAFQGFGLVPIDVKRDGVDALATGTYKWILGPSGYAFLYVSRELLQKLPKGLVGWQGIHFDMKESPSQPFDFDHLHVADEATRFDTGVHGVVPSYGIGAALDFALQHNTIGRFADTQKRLVRPILDAAKRLNLEIQSPEDFEELGATVNIATKDPLKSISFLGTKGITVSWHWVPGMKPGIRVAPHYYNTEEEVNRFINVLHEMKESGQYF